MVSRACVLTGEGAKGAWQGAVLSEQLKEYDLLVGVSSGALNAAGYSLLGPMLVDLWREIEGIGDVFTGNWRMLWDSGFLSPGPLLKLLTRRVLGSVFSTRLVFPTIKCSTSELEFHVIEPGTVCTEAHIRLIAAAGAIPGLSSAIDGRIDGGMRTLCPLSIPIKSGVDEIDIVIAGAPFQPPEWPSLDGLIWMRAAAFSARAVETMLWQIMVSDIEMALDCNSDEGKRQVTIRCIYPEQRIGWVLGFNHCQEMADLVKYAPVEIVLR